MKKYMLRFVLLLSSVKGGRSDCGEASACVSCAVVSGVAESNGVPVSKGKRDMSEGMDMLRSLFVVPSGFGLGYFGGRPGPRFGFTSSHCSCFACILLVSC